MKKIILMLLIAAVSRQLKAQQLNTNPKDPQLFKLPKSLVLLNFKLSDSTLLKGLSSLPKSNSLAMLQGIKGNANAFTVYSRMPVAKLNSANKMPVAKLGDEQNMHYTMPVKKIDVVDPLAKVMPVNP